MINDHFGDREEMIARYRALQAETSATIATLRAEVEQMRSELTQAWGCAYGASDFDADTIIGLRNEVATLRADLARVEAERDEALAILPTDERLDTMERATRVAYTLGRVEYDAYLDVLAWVTRVHAHAKGGE